MKCDVVEMLTGLQVAPTKYRLFWTSSITFQLRLKSFSIKSIRHCTFTRRIWPMCFGIYMNRFETRERLDHFKDCS
uniref:Uncharacterized protein n=1 Tax=Cucumis melo TaxID=3656 RepID=A0A9I9EIY7_CUCME